MHCRFAVAVRHLFPPRPHQKSLGKPALSPFRAHLANSEPRALLLPTSPSALRRRIQPSGLRKEKPDQRNRRNHGRRNQSPQREDSLKQVHGLLLLDSYVFRTPVFGEGTRILALGCVSDAD